MLTSRRRSRRRMRQGTGGAGRDAVLNPECRCRLAPAGQPEPHGACHAIHLQAGPVQHDVQHGTHGRAQECVLATDLVIDCTGRASRLPAWLQSWQYAAPEEERVEIGSCCTSAYFKRTVEFALGAAIAKAGLIVGVTPAQPRPGVLIAQEPSVDGDCGVPRWVLGVGGHRGDHAAATIEGMRQRAYDIGSPGLALLTQGGERIGEVMRHHFPCSQRRRCERLARFPQRLLALGDARTSFNPIYGQGMTVAACQALALRQTLNPGLNPGLDAKLHRRFFSAPRHASSTRPGNWRRAAN